MSSFENIDSLTVTNTEGRLIGRVKWFNNKAGYGFITVTDGSRSGSDIFVHHTSILSANKRYKYLDQGEYVEFTCSESPSGIHQYSATNVTGVNNGSLMCDSTNNVTNSRFGHFINESQETFYEHSKYTKRMDQHRPPRILLVENEFRELKNNIPMAPKSCDTNTSWRN
jgi:CspA family cold shock protein